MKSKRSCLVFSDWFKAYDYGLTIAHYKTRLNCQSLKLNMFRPYEPTETDVGSDLKTMHTDVNDPIGPAPACRVGSGRPVCGQLNTN